MRRKLATILLLATVVLITAYVVWNWEDFKRIRYLRKEYFLHQAILVGLTLCINGYITKLFLAFFGIRMELREWFGLAVLASLGNYLTPLRGGVALKGIYLQKRLNFPYSMFASMMAASYILLFLIAGILGIAILISIQQLYGTMQWKLFILFSAVSVAMAAILMVSPRMENHQNRLLRFLKKSLDGWGKIKRSKALITKVTSLLILSYFIICFRLYYGYRMLSIEASILPTFLTGLLVSFVLPIGLTPGNFGIQETAIGFGSKLMGTSFNEGLMVASIVRVTGMAIIFTLGPVFVHILLRKDDVQTSEKARV